MSVLEVVSAAYDHKLQEHGATHESVMWEDPRSQIYRFEVFAQFLSKEAAGNPLRINDFGCGYGALFTYLIGLPNAPLETYIGYDISLEMIKTARCQIKDTRARFIHSDRVSETADFSFASGTYSLKANAEDADWAAYIKSSLKALWEKSSMGIAFNLLDREKTDANDEWLYYGNSREFLSFCRAEFSSDTQLISHPQLADFTIFVRRPVR